MTLVTRILLPLLLFVGCHRPVDGSERARLPGNPHSERQVGAADAGVVPPIRSAWPEGTKRETANSLPACAQGAGRDTNASQRLAFAVQHCAQGLLAKSSPIAWKVVDTSATAAVLEAGEARCVRVIVAMNEPGQAAHVSVVDSNGRILASTSGTIVLVLPADGPLCVPSQVGLQVQVDAANAPLSGFIAMLESP
jgi:hypothetical protein